MSAQSETDRNLPGPTKDYRVSAYYGSTAIVFSLLQVPELGNSLREWVSEEALCADKVASWWVRSGDNDCN